MKKTAVFLSLFFFILTLSACASALGADQISGAEMSVLHTDAASSKVSDVSKESDEIMSGGENNMDLANSNVLVAYFSATGTTQPLAEYTADILGADLYEIVPKQPYTQADLAYYTNGRADREQNDSSARPAISSSVPNMEQYEVVFLGYPIWHGQAPRIISTFLENYDFSGKTIIPFCTSHSSGIGSSDTNLHTLAPDADWRAGRRFAGGTSRNDMEQWIAGLD